MGNKLTKDSNAHAINIDERLKHCHEEYRVTKVYLLLGTKSCGKTTFFKQMQFLQVCNKDNQMFISMYSYLLNSIRNDCVSTMIKLCSQMEDSNTIQKLQTLSIDDESELVEIKDTIKRIWQSNHKRFLFTIPENMKLYLNKIDDIMDEKYEISTEDIIAHSTVSGFDELNFNTNEHRFNFIDIGSNPLNVKKLHLLDHTNLVIYIVSLSDYCNNIITTDGVLMNAMQYSLQHFFEIVKTRKLDKSEWCIFFNKDDIFKQKLKDGISLSVCFGDKWNGDEFINPTIPLIVSYFIRNNFHDEIPIDLVNMINKYIKFQYMIDGNECDEDEYFLHCYEEAVTFIHKQFTEKWSEIMPEQYGKHHWMKQYLYCHVATATDTMTVLKIFWDIWSIVIRSNLKRGIRK